LISSKCFTESCDFVWKKQTCDKFGWWFNLFPFYKKNRPMFKSVNYKYMYIKIIGH
jgi:hypothetical protein